MTGDETIHEFPSYSFVLGDLHAHVINVFFVLAVLGILYAWIKRNSGKSWKQKEIFLLGLFLGIFLFSNTWDFMIYYVVICGTLFFGNLKRYLNSTDMKPSDMRTGNKMERCAMDRTSADCGVDFVYHSIYSLKVLWYRESE